MDRPSYTEDELLAAYRSIRASGVTVEALAEQVGYTKSAFYRWMSGTMHPAPRTLELLAKGLAKFGRATVRAPSQRNEPAHASSSQVLAMVLDKAPPASEDPSTLEELVYGMGLEAIRYVLSAHQPELP